jgi:hypothetical protein
MAASMPLHMHACISDRAPLRTSFSPAACRAVQVLLGGGVDPNFVVRESPGEEHSWSLLEYCFGLAQDALGAESETLEVMHWGSTGRSVLHVLHPLECIWARFACWSKFGGGKQGVLTAA